MISMNNSNRKKLKAKEYERKGRSWFVSSNKRIITLVERAYNRDPRIKAHIEEERQRKEAIRV